MEKVINAVHDKLDRMQAEFSRIQAEQESIRDLLQGLGAAQAARSRPASALLPGQFDGNWFRVWQGIKEYLRIRGNPGVSQGDIVRDLVREGTLFKNKKYPKRSVSLAIANKAEIFEQRDGLVYLRSKHVDPSVAEVRISGVSPPALETAVPDARELGRRGGQARALRLSPEERSNAASHAARTRWAEEPTSETPQSEPHGRK